MVASDAIRYVGQSASTISLKALILQIFCSLSTNAAFQMA